MNIQECKINGSSPTNLLEFGFEKYETKIHEAQKPEKLIEFLIKLTTTENPNCT
jgi:DNA modification methylase